jgi:hypothetical protein
MNITEKITKKRSPAEILIPIFILFKVSSSVAQEGLPRACTPCFLK